MNHISDKHTHICTKLHKHAHTNKQTSLNFAIWGKNSEKQLNCNTVKSVRDDLKSSFSHQLCVRLIKLPHILQFLM